VEGGHGDEERGGRGARGRDLHVGLELRGDRVRRQLPLGPHRALIPAAAAPVTSCRPALYTTGPSARIRDGTCQRRTKS
jgi:hypothetical protein